MVSAWHDDLPDACQTGRDGRVDYDYQVADGVGGLRAYNHTLIPIGIGLPTVHDEDPPDGRRNASGC